MTSKDKIVIVTGLFNIGRGEIESSFKRSFDHYLECFSRMLQIDYPMVIYIEPENESFIWKYRKPENTRVIVKTLDYLHNFPFYDKIQKIRNDPKWYNQSGWLKDSTQGSLELYNPLVMSKTFMLNDAVLSYDRDPKFSNKKWIWLDAGVSNTIGNPKDWFTPEFSNKLANHIGNKMLFVAFPYDKSTTEVHGFAREGMNRYAGKETEYVCRGGLFGGTPDAIHEFNNDYYQLLQSSMNENLMGTEESLMTLFSYKNPHKCNIKFIEGNGLIVKYLSDTKSEPEDKEPEYPLAFYSLTFNTPKQFKMYIDSFLKAYPDDFYKHKKYVIDNSTDAKAKSEYRKLFTEYDFEIIHEGENIGIQDGRQLAAEHFDKTDHRYYIFCEEDIVWIPKDEPIQNKKGFIRYVPNLFNSSMEIMDEYKFDYMKMILIQFYGDSLKDWASTNVPEDKRKIYYPEREDGNQELRWKTKIHWLGTYKNVPFAAGWFHVDNWITMICKKGNHQMYLADPYVYKYEQTVMSQCATYQREGKLDGACLLASPVDHNRVYFYQGNQRKENKFYK